MEPKIEKSETPEQESPQQAVHNTDKIKEIFGLGVTANYFSLSGVLLAWMLLTKAEWIPDFWTRLFFVFSIAPAFMADALHCYVLSRIRLDFQKGYNDVLITEEGKSIVSRYFIPWRILSFVLASLLAFRLLSTLSDNDFGGHIKTAFTFTFIIYFLASRIFYIKHAVPLRQGISNKSTRRRTYILLCFSVPWLLWLLIRSDKEYAMAGYGMFFHSTVFFLLSSAFHPLPTRQSILWANNKKHKNFEPPPTMDVIPNAKINFAEAETNESKVWQNELSFKMIDKISTPLFELPIFYASGEALLSGDSTTFLFIFNCEIKKTFHRSLVSMKDGLFFLTSDFGTSEAKFPESVKYNSVASEMKSHEFLKKHLDFVAGYSSKELVPFTDPPWAAIKDMNERIIIFLRNDASHFLETIGYKK
ncbi:MAG: hypothetical protein HQM10_09980 [Candidatus Riflebacteria bacterium]|nr:hypothetical protein [Candidatus Riflebacteria bacterium]